MTTARVTKANEAIDISRCAITLPPRGRWMSGNLAQERALQRLPYESFA